MPKLNVTVDLKEGMKIAPIGNQEEKYTIIKSSKDNELYMLFQKHILKISEIKNLDTDYICVDVSSFKDEVKVLETENSNLYIVDNDFCIYTFIDKELNNTEDDFVSLDLRIIRMTREEYMLKKGDNYYFKCRDIIADEYNKQNFSEN